MKKKILLFFVCCMTMTMAAKAQLYVGGTLGIGCTTTKIEGSSETAATYSITPELGYQINKWAAIGTYLSVTYTEPAGDDNDVTLIGISPYLRTTFLHTKAVDFFVDAAFSYLHAKDHAYDESIDGWGIALNPGFSINFSDRWKLLGRTTFFQHSSIGDEVKLKETGFALANNFTVGVIYKF